MATTLAKRTSVNFPVQQLLLPGLAAVFFLPAMGLLLKGQYRILVAVMVLGVLLILWRINRTAAICLNFAYLLLLGDIRRIVTVITGGETSTTDPLLLVGALFCLYVAFPILRKLRAQDNLSKTMLVLMCVMVLEIFNPKQGSLFVGLSAGLFWIVPLMWFWIGRQYATEELLSKVLFGIVVPLGIVAGLLGLYQNFVGFLPWEQAWIDAAVAAGYNSLFLAAGQVRAFGFSVNGIEYVNLMLFTAVVIGPLIRSRKAIYSLFLPMMLVSIFLASSRTTIVKVVFAYAAMWAVRGYAKNRAKVLPRMIFALVCGLGGLGYSVVHFAAGDSGSSGGRATKAGAATSHVIEGLANPLDSKKSTAGAHAGMFTYGIMQGIINPVGYGLGSVTLGLGRYGGGDSGEATLGTTEVDISDAFLSMGIAGGVSYLLMVIFTLGFLLEYLGYGDKLLGYCLVGIFMSMLSGWIGQGEYAMAPIMCFTIGFLAKQHNEHRTAASQPKVRSAVPSRLQSARY